MATVLNTIYPPQVSSFMPSFLYNKDAEVWFDISSYNDDMIDKIKFIHISMVDQRNNQSVFKGINFKNEVYPQLYPVKFDKEKMWDAGKQLYKVSIPPQLLKTAPYYNVNQYYKVQLRFDLTGSPENEPHDDYNNDPTKFFFWNSKDDNYANALELASYINLNEDNFSEWSTSTLIRPILIPQIALNFKTNSVNNTPSVKEESGIDFDNLFPSTDAWAIGELKFEQDAADSSKVEEQTEHLSWYRITLWDKDKKTEYSDTGKVYASKNQINTILDISFLKEFDSYQMLCLEYETNGGYTETVWYTLKTVNYNDSTANYVNYVIKCDEENGLVKINLIGLDYYDNGYLVIRRSSHKTNFKVWELVQKTDVSNLDFLTVKDATIESMIGYKYQIQYMNDDMIQAPIITDIQCCEFFGALLGYQDTLLRLEFDFQVTGISNAARRTKVDTIGGRYPKFTQNSRLKYRTYTISGRISAEDNGDLFLTKKNMIGNDEFYNYRYKNNCKYPADNHTQHNQIKLSDDYLYEREFRNAVNDWLDNGKPKLFRSMTEGNLAVMLDGVSLSPDQQLSRRVCKFSATMYEIGDGSSLDSLVSLGILNTGYASDGTYVGNVNTQTDSGETEGTTIDTEFYAPAAYGILWKNFGDE